MAPVNHGYRKEDEMKTFLNNKVAGTLSQNLRELVINLFGVVDPNGVVYCEDGIDFTKPDFVLSYLTKKRYVSMKSGRADICHTEMANTFIPFLRSIGVSEETLRTILLHHYGDGTVNGTGKKRYDNRQVYEWLKDRIKKGTRFIMEIMKRGALLVECKSNCILMTRIGYTQKTYIVVHYL